MNQNRFNRITNTWPLTFGINNQRDCHVKIGRFIDIKRTDPIQMLDDRHPGMTDHRLNQPLTTAWNDDVHILIHSAKKFYSLPINRRHQKNTVPWQARLGKPGLQSFGYGAIRMKRLGTATKKSRIPCLKTKNRRVTGDIGSRLINNSNHPDRHTHL